MVLRGRLPLALGVLLLTGGAVGAGSAQGATPVPLYSGYATGTVVHVDAAQVGASQVASAELAFAGASVASGGLPSVTQGSAPYSKAGLTVNEMGQVVQPALPGGTPKLAGTRSFARGSGLEVGLGTTLPSSSPSVTDFGSKVQVSAPDTQHDDSSLFGVPAAPAATATAVRGTADATWAGDRSCVLGKPISSGLGYAADAQLVNAGTPAPLVKTSSAQGAVSQSLSQTQLVAPRVASGAVAPGARNAGLRSGTTQVIAPVTLFAGTPNQLVIEVVPLGLFATAGGLPGTARISYAPDASVGPTTPIVRITSGTGPAATVTQITTQDLLGKTGLTIPASPLATVTVGTVPHAIGDPSKPPTVSADGTLAAAAVDAVSVQLVNPDPTTHVSDIRIGHMEARAQVPAGGIPCALPVTKTATPTRVLAGDRFRYDITITNPYDCVLTHLTAVDDITATRGVKFRVLSAVPAGAIAGHRVRWNTLPDIAPHSSIVLTLQILTDRTSAAGRITDTVRASGSCGRDSAIAGGSVDVPVAGGTTLHAPTVTGRAKPRPRTG